MWIPKDTDELEAAVTRGDLEETASFDAKKELPGKNASTAVDVAAMATEGGVVVYGVGEDENGHLSLLNPIDLKGTAERIDQIVSTSITEVPVVEVRSYPSDKDPSTGYILVIVPASPRAPHQVVVGNDRRFYGRSAKGNRLLSEGEIALLYQRRNERQQDRDRLLEEAISASPYEPQGGVGFIHAFARPVPPDRALWDRAVESAGDRSALLHLMMDAAAAYGRGGGLAPEAGGTNPTWHRDDADTWRLSSQAEPKPDLQWVRYVTDVTVSTDGSGRLFCGNAAERIDLRSGPSPDGQLLIYERDIAATFAAFLATMGAPYDAAGFHGQVDIGLKVTNLDGGYSHAFITAQQYPIFGNIETFAGNSFARTERITADELSDPRAVARRVLHDLFDATTRRTDFDPFEEVR